MTFNYLIITISLIIFLLLVLFFGPNRWDRFYKNFTLILSALIFFISLHVWFNCSWLSVSYPIYSKLLNIVNLQCLFVVDLTSIFFILITTILFPFCILASWEMSQVRLLYFNLVLIEFVLVLTFTVFDLFLFCLFFEAVLIPMFFIILWWGSRERRIKALTYFFLYTLLGSVFLFIVIFAIYYEIGSTSFFSMYLWTATQYNFAAGIFVLNYITLLFFFVFAVKIPVFPFHIWLPEAHVEAPTVGSVILAGLLLKLGGYGILRFLYMFLVSFEYWQIFVLVFLVLSIWLGSVLATRQLDLKRIIAYSSIAHMNFALVGVFTNNVLGAVGAYSLFLSHGIVSSALFLLIGFLYDRHHTRLLHYFGGLVQVMPLWVFFFFAFVASNFSFPGTSNFIGEILIFIAMGASPLPITLLLVVGFSTFLTVLYSLFMFNRISFGALKIQYIAAFSDINRREFSVIFPLFLLNLIFGLCPTIFLSPIYYSILWTSQNCEINLITLFQTAPSPRIILPPEDEFIIHMFQLQTALDLCTIDRLPLLIAVDNQKHINDVLFRIEFERLIANEFTISEQFALQRIGLSKAIFSFTTSYTIGDFYLSGNYSVSLDTALDSIRVYEASLWNYGQKHGLDMSEFLTQFCRAFFPTSEQQVLSDFAHADQTAEYASEPMNIAGPFSTDAIYAANPRGFIQLVTVYQNSKVLNDEFLSGKFLQ